MSWIVRPVVLFRHGNLVLPCMWSHKLQDENAELVKQLDDTRCELGYDRTELARLKYRNIIRDAAPPQHEHASTFDRRLAKANDQLMVLWGKQDYVRYR